MANENLKILIASAPKTGNTWVRTILAELFELPVVFLDLPFSRAQADALGPRWVMHQHFCPTPEVLRWIREAGVQVLTPLRHPADMLVSHYHFVRNYPENYRGDAGINRALAADHAARAKGNVADGAIVDGALVAIVQDRLIADLAIAISWKAKGYETIRYEDLRSRPLEIMREVAPRFGEVSPDALPRAVEECGFDALRLKAGAEAKFFRKGEVGEWRDALPARAVRQFAQEPYRSQFAFLGYEMPNEVAPPSAVDITAPIFEAVFDEFRQSGWELSVAATDEQAFFQWLNATAEEDPTPGEIPLVTNLAAFIYRRRTDLQAAFPNPFRADRVAYADWFLRYAKEEFALDRAFLVPTALSWIRN